MFETDNENKITYDNLPDTSRINKARSNLMLSLFLLILAVFILIFSFAVIDKTKYRKAQHAFTVEEILASKTGNSQYLDDGLFKKDPILPIIFHTADNNFQFIKYHHVLAGDTYIMDIPIKEIFALKTNITKFTSVFLDHLSGELRANSKTWKVTFYGFNKDHNGSLYDKMLFDRLRILSVYLVKRGIPDHRVSVGVLPLDKHDKPDPNPTLFPKGSQNSNYISVHLTIPFQARLK